MPYNFYKCFEGVLEENGEEVGRISQTYFVRKDLNTRKGQEVAGKMMEERGQVNTSRLGATEIIAFKARDFDRCCMDARAADPEAFLNLDKA